MGQASSRLKPPLVDNFHDVDLPYDIWCCITGYLDAFAIACLAVSSPMINRKIRNLGLDAVWQNAAVSYAFNRVYPSRAKLLYCGCDISPDWHKPFPRPGNPRQVHSANYSTQHELRTDYSYPNVRPRNLSQACGYFMMICDIRSISLLAAMQPITIEYLSCVEHAKDRKAMTIALCGAGPCYQALFSDRRGASSVYRHDHTHILEINIRPELLNFGSTSTSFWDKERQNDVRCFAHYSRLIAFLRSWIGGKLDPTWQGSERKHARTSFGVLLNGKDYRSSKSMNSTKWLLWTCTVCSREYFLEGYRERPQRNQYPYGWVFSVKQWRKQESCEDVAAHIWKLMKTGADPIDLRVRSCKTCDFRHKEWNHRRINQTKHKGTRMSQPTCDTGWPSSYTKAQTSGR